MGEGLPLHPSPFDHARLESVDRYAKASVDRIRELMIQPTTRQLQNENNVIDFDKHK